MVAWRPHWVYAGDRRSDRAPPSGREIGSQIGPFGQVGTFFMTALQVITALIRSPSKEASVMHLKVTAWAASLERN